MYHNTTTQSDFELMTLAVAGCWSLLVLLACWLCRPVTESWRESKLPVPTSPSLSVSVYFSDNQTHTNFWRSVCISLLAQRQRLYFPAASPSSVSFSRTGWLRYAPMALLLYLFSVGSRLRKRLISLALAFFLAPRNVCVEDASCGCGCAVSVANFHLLLCHFFYHFFLLGGPVNSFGSWRLAARTLPPHLPPTTQARQTSTQHVSPQPAASTAAQ